MDLPTFLLARADEIDPLRGRLSDGLPHHPYCAGMTLDDYDEQYEFRPDLCDCGWPARVLAECAAKRAIVAMHTGAHECPTEDSSCGWCVDSDECETLLALAQPFADHPEFDPSWR